MRHLGTILGTAIAGIFVMSVWGAFAGEYGIGGGWFAGLAIIGIMWYLNHAIGIHCNHGAWVDMALGIGVAGTTKVMFIDGFQTGMDALPTLGVVLLGGFFGGLAAYALEQTLGMNENVVEEDF